MKTYALWVMFCGFWTLNAQASISVSGGLTRDFTLRPGDEVQEVIEITNTSDAVERVTLYQTDYRYSSDGSNQYDEPGSSSRSNAGWVTFSPHEIDIPPQGTAQVLMKIAVPADAGLFGTYWSMIMIEPAPEITEDPAAGGQPLIAVNTVVRHAIQVSTTIQEGGQKTVTPEGKLYRQDGLTILSLDLVNSGDYLVRPGVWVEIYDDAGQMLDRLASDPMRIFPGCSVRHIFKLELAAGNYQALAVIDNEDGDVWGTRYNIEIE
jgi:hypothetical protein